MNKHSAGFILMEVLISTLMTGMIVLGVIALFLPLKKVMLKQNAWISLQNTAQTMTMLLVRQLKGAEIMNGSNKKITIKKGEKHMTFFIKPTSRRYADHKKISALYAREGLKQSLEWVEGVTSISFRYDIKHTRTNKTIRQHTFNRDSKTRVVGVEINCQLTAEQGLHEPWRIYVAI